MTYQVLKAREDFEVDEDVLETYDLLDDDYEILDESHIEVALFEPHGDGIQIVGEDWGAGTYIFLSNEHGDYEQFTIDESDSTETVYTLHA